MKYNHACVACAVVSFLSFVVAILQFYTVLNNGGVREFATSAVSVVTWLTLLAYFIANYKHLRKKSHRSHHHHHD